MKKINVLGVNIDVGPVRELRAKAIGFLSNDVVNTIDIVRNKTLVEAGGRDDLKEVLEGMDLTVIGEKSIMDAAGITDKRYIQEVENQTFLKEFFHHMDRRRLHVFLLTDTKEHLADMDGFFRNYYEGMSIDGAFSMDRCLDDEDMVVNEINGSAAEVVICALSSPYKEEFVKSQKKKLNIKLLLLVGYLPSMSKKQAWEPGLISRLIGAGIFKKRLSEYKKKKEGDKR